MRKALVTRITATLILSAAGFSTVVVVATSAHAQTDASALVQPDAESRTTETLKRVWRSMTGGIVPGLEQDADAVEAVSAEDYFTLKPPLVADWGMQPPPLRLASPNIKTAFKPIAGPIDIRIAGESPRFGAVKDLCSIGASARAEASAAVWQPSFHCTPLNATNVRLNADFTYDWRGERLITPLAFSVAQVFKLGPYAAELSGGLRTQLDKLEVKPHDWSYRAVITLPFPE